MNRISELFSNDWDNSEAVSSIDFYDAPPEFRIRKKIKYSATSKAVQAIMLEYCNNSTIHGIKHLGEERRPKWEKYVWIFIIIFLFIISIFHLHYTYVKWQTNPVIVTLSDKSTPVWNIPFPAITFCPETKAQLKIFNFTDVYRRLWNNRFENGTLNSNCTNEEEFKNFKAMLQICSLDHISKLKFPEGSIEQYLDVDDFVQRIENVEPDVNVSLAFCKFGDEIGMCEKFNMTKVYSDEGICYKFNGLRNEDLYQENTAQYANKPDKEDGGILNWNLEDGYSINDSKTLVNNNYPKRVLGAGIRAGLFIALQGFDFDLDYFCRDYFQGFKVLLHSPDDSALIAKHYIRVSLWSEALISLIPNIILTSKSLIPYSPLSRQCYFRNERQLQFFKIYSQSNCESECLANHTLSKCKCVKFSMPRLNDTAVCNIEKLLCVDEAENEYLFIEFNESLKRSKTSFRGETTCNCLPACTSLTYDAEISQNSYDFKSLLQAMQDEYFEEFPELKLARLAIFFKQNEYQTDVRSERSKLYGFTDFAASCGGLLALFTGVSALSMAEIIYYTTVRLKCNLLMRKQSQNMIDEMVMQDFDVSLTSINSTIKNNEND